jgi:DNA polymerase-3 subunit alpha
MQLPVLSPDVKISGRTFTPVIEDAAPSIRFGLAAIKGVGEGAADLIIAERRENGPYESFHDFVVRSSEKAINKRVIEALIKTGAFDSLGQDRAHLLHDMDAELAEAITERRDKEAGQGTLFLGEPEKETSGDSIPAMPSGLEPMAKSEKLAFEKELLGLYLSGHPMDAYRGLDLALDSFTAPEQLNDFDDRSTYRLCGILTGIQTRYTKKDNKQFAIFTLATREHNYEVIMFPEAYDRNRSRFEDQKLVLLRGQIARRNGEMSLQGHDLFDLESSIPRLIQRINFILYPDRQTEDFLTLLREVIDREYQQSRDGKNTREHSSEVALSFLIDNQILETDSSKALKIAINGENYKELRRHPAVAGIRVEALPVQTVDDRRPWEKKRAR